MGLKLLVFPSIVVLSLVLAVWFIRPGVMEIFEQRAIKTTKQEALSKVETVESNIKAISQSLNSKQEMEALVNRYYPETMDQERAVDTVNFLAQQSGVTITALAVRQELQRKSSQVPAPLEEGGGESVDLTTNTEVPATPPKVYKVEVSVVGPYENIRSFFDRLHHTDRLHVLTTFSVGKKEATLQSEGSGLPENFLKGTVAFDFLYSSKKRTGNVLLNPLFQTNTFDYSGANQLNDFINSPVSDLAVPAVGRTNPFQSLP